MPQNYQLEVNQDPRQYFISMTYDLHTPFRLLERIEIVFYLIDISIFRRFTLDHLRYYLHICNISTPSTHKATIILRQIHSQKLTNSSATGTFWFFEFQIGVKIHFK